MIDSFRCTCGPDADEKCNEAACAVMRKPWAGHPVVRSWERRIQQILVEQFDVADGSIHLHNFNVGAQQRLPFSAFRCVSTVLIA